MLFVYLVLLLVGILNVPIMNGQPVLFADGGYQTGLVECITQWTYKEKLENGGNLETVLTGCVNIEDFKPYPYYDDDKDEIATLIEPSEDATNKKRWCPVLRDVYNPTPKKTEANKFNWGYCLDLSATDKPSDSNTLVPTDPPPLLTSNPTTSPPSSPPTISEQENGSGVDETDAESEDQSDEPKSTESPTAKTLVPTISETEQVPQTDDDTADEGSQTTDKSVTVEEWTFLGIGIAGTLVLVALVLTVVVLRNMNKSRKIPLDEEPVKEADLEENTMTRN